MSDLSPIARIDPFPFQHRVAEMMQTDAPTLALTATVGDAVQALASGRQSAVIVLDAVGRPAGIATERDILVKVAAGNLVMSAPVTQIMSAPVTAVHADAFLYVALARLNRLPYRHLAVIAPAEGKYVGLLDTRVILRQRASLALGIVDEIAEAANPAALRAMFVRLPEIGRSLRAEGIAAHQVAAVISGIIGDMTARAGALAVADMRNEKRGEAPAPWCLLVLGSAGRGESLLAADQDNALLHGWHEDDHPWFVEFGERVARILNQAGIPFCQGGVMASQPRFRHNLAGWRANLDQWLEQPTPAAILNADIFYDFAPVAGETEMAAQLRDLAMHARDARLFLNLMAQEIGDKRRALGLFGRFKTRKGRVDLKMGGLFPIVAGGRVLALRLGCPALSSRDRWRAAQAAGIINQEDLAQLLDAHEMILGLILDQQLVDLARGNPASSRVEIRRLMELEQDRLKRALHLVEEIHLIVRNALGEAAMGAGNQTGKAGQGATRQP